MFQGATALTLDAKGRLAVPARHRDTLAPSGKVVVTAYPDGCLWVLPAETWPRMREQVLAAPSVDRASVLFKRLLIGYANEAEVDATSRVLITPEQRDFAQLDRDVWLVGQGSLFELWSDANWRDQRKQIQALAAQPLPAAFQNLAL
jgi:MraZ protein